MRTLMLLTAVLAMSIVTLPAAYPQVETAVVPNPVDANNSDAIVLRRRTSTDYSQNLSNFEALLHTSIETETVVGDGDNLSEILFRKYRIAPSSAFAAYRQIERFVIDENELSDDAALRAGQKIVLPELPPIALSEPNESNPLNRFPKLDMDSRVLKSDQAALSATSTGSSPRVILDNSRRGAQETISKYVLAAAEAINLLDGGGGYEVESAPIDITLESQDSVADGGVIDEQTEEFIRQKLKQQALQAPVLFIFDDGWPDDEEFVASRDFIVDAIAKIRRFYKLGSPRWKDEFLSAASAGNTPPTAHALKIKQSLAEFRALEPSERKVTVIYLPIFRSQKFTVGVLEELVALNLTLADVGDARGDPPGGELLNAAYESAAKYVARVSTGPRRNIVTSDTAVIEALLWFCVNYSEVSRRPFFANLSWTMPNYRIQPAFPSIYHGLFVAAAGNGTSATVSQPKSVYELHLQFASRARYPGDVLAVMNVAGNGAPACESNVFGENSDGFEASFSGKSVNGICGTSFSSPRVAWLLAAREAIRPRLTTPENLTRSATEELATFYDSNASGYGRIHLNIGKLFADTN